MTSFIEFMKIKLASISSLHFISKPTSICGASDHENSVFQGNILLQMSHARDLVGLPRWIQIHRALVASLIQLVWRSFRGRSKWLSVETNSLQLDSLRTALSLIRLKHSQQAYSWLNVTSQRYSFPALNCNDTVGLWKHWKLGKYQQKNLLWVVLYSAGLHYYYY